MFAPCAAKINFDCAAQLAGELKNDTRVCHHSAIVDFIACYHNTVIDCDVKIYPDFIEEMTIAMRKLLRCMKEMPKMHDGCFPIENGVEDSFAEN